MDHRDIERLRGSASTGPHWALGGPPPCRRRTLLTARARTSAENLRLRAKPDSERHDEDHAPLLLRLFQVDTESARGTPATGRPRQAHLAPLRRRLANRAPEPPDREQERSADREVGPRCRCSGRKSSVGGRWPRCTGAVARAGAKCRSRAPCTSVRLLHPPDSHRSTPLFAHFARRHAQ